MSEEVPVVSFKKRAVKGNSSRKRETSDNETAEEDISTETLREIKLQQTFRGRKNGSSMDSLSKKLTTISPTGDVDANETRTIESVMGTQYSSQMDYGIQSNNIPHKKLMDQFIEDKLGLAQTAKVQKRQDTEEDNLYKIPEHIKAMEGKEKNAKPEDSADNGIVPAWSTQLAEVALPISFKLRNIEATERLAASTSSTANNTNAATNYRFSTQERTMKVHPSMAAFVTEVAPEGAAAGSAPGAGNDTNKGKRPQQSSDDYALNQYKKRQMNHRR